MVGAKRFFSDGEEHVVKVAVIGDPNAGKSTLINSILGRRVRMIPVCNRLYCG